MAIGNPTSASFPFDDDDLSHHDDDDGPPIRVVTVFLWDGARVLLLLRSDNVSTYPGHWAGISGYLETADPLDQAYREVLEETGIDRIQLTLCNRAEPIDVYDDVDAKTFIVYPFLFAVDPNVAIRLNEETEAFEWSDIDEWQLDLERLTVPALHEAFDVVWPPWGIHRMIEANLSLAIHWLRNDRDMGAGQMARAAATEFAKLLRLVPDESFAKFRPRLAEALQALRSARPAMAPPVNMMSDLAEDFARARDRASILAAIDERIRHSEWAEHEVARKAAALIQPGEQILTLSYSGTVARMLIEAAANIRRVWVCESRPMLEGRRMAEKLADAALPVTVITDAQAFAVMPDIARVVIGADAVTAAGAPVNKVGSAMTALAARHYGKHVTLVCSTLKFRRPSDSQEVIMERNPESEVWEEAPEDIEITNIYYEAVPAELLTEVVTENGVSTTTSASPPASSPPTT